MRFEKIRETIKNITTMTLVRFKPNTKDFFRDSLIPSNMMSLIDDIFNDSAATFERNVFFTPRADVLEKADRYEIRLALPGMKKEDINIEVEKNTLKVNGEKSQQKTEEGEKFHRTENYYGKFSRVFNLPEHASKDAIEAEFENGMLNITVPKLEVKEARNIVKIK